MRWFSRLFVAVLTLVPSAAFAATVDQILSGIDKNLTYDSRESTLTMTVTKGDRVKVYKMHSFGRGADEGVMEYLEPARDKGTKMYRKGDELWMFLPAVEKVQKISGHMLRQGMMGSDMSYEDLMEASGWAAMYTGVVEGEETIEGRKCWKLRLTAKTTEVSYPVRLVWVDQEAYIPLKQELYALSGMVLKSWTMSNIQVIEGRQTPMKMVVEDKLQAGSKTELVFDNVDYSVELQEEVFSTRWLER